MITKNTKFTGLCTPTIDAPQEIACGNILIQTNSPENNIQNTESSILVCAFLIRRMVKIKFRMDTISKTIRNVIVIVHLADGKAVPGKLK